MKSTRVKCVSSTIERSHRKSSNTENQYNFSSSNQNTSRPIHIKTQENDLSSIIRVQKPLKVIDIFAVDSKTNRMKSDSQANVKNLPPIPAYLFANPNQKKAYSVNVKSSAYSYKIKFGQEAANVSQKIFSPVCPNQTISARENNFNSNQIKSGCNSALSSQSIIKEDLTFDSMAKYEHLSILKKRKSRARPNSEVTPKLNYFINAIHRTDFANPLEKRRRMLNCSHDAPSMENSLLEKHVKPQENESFQRYKNCSSSPTKLKKEPSLSFIEPESPVYRHLRTSSMRDTFYQKQKTDTKTRHDDLDNTLKFSYEKQHFTQHRNVSQEQDIMFTQSDGNDLNEYMDMRKNTPLDKIDFSRR